MEMEGAMGEFKRVYDKGRKGRGGGMAGGEVRREGGLKRGFKRGGEG